MLSIFSCASELSVCLFGEMTVQIFCPFFDWVVCFLILHYMSYLYILEIKPLIASFSNVFSHSIGCLFILFRASFALQKHLSLIRSLELPLNILICTSLGSQEIDKTGLDQQKISWGSRKGKKNLQNKMQI